MIKNISKRASTLMLSILMVSCSQQITSTPPSTLTPEGEVAYESIRIDNDDPSWWDNAIFYEIWPRSFYDADGDGSGDFDGMTSKLPYLQELGVNGIWLTPVFEAPSYHGYDFQDFYSVESDYGTMEDFEEFVSAAHEHGIKVILDLVINHISDGHEWFQKSAAQEPGYEDYFIWKKEIPKHWGKAWADKEDNSQAVWHWNEQRGEFYYGAFGPTQPDVNLRNPKVVDEMNKLATFWLEKGVDGFRLDAVRYAIEDETVDGQDADQADTDATIIYWTQFSQHVKSINPGAMLVAEAWADMPTIGKYYDDGNGLDSAFDFDFGYVVSGILNAGGERSADFGTVKDGEEDNTRQALWANLKSRKATAPISFFSPFLTNHDQNRIMHTLGEDWSKAKLAATLLMTTPGTLYMYYGEEIGLSQYATGDDQYRRAIMQWEDNDAAGFNDTGEFWLDQSKWFPWIKEHKPWWEGYWQSQRANKNASVDAQAANPDSLLNHYKKLLQIRNDHVALQFPNEIRYYPVDNMNAWVVQNIKDEQKRLTLVNLNPEAEARFPVPKSLRGEYIDLLSGNKITLAEEFTLEAGQSLIL
ncbi:alpha-amylase family glycosyl hydrolase [Alteromonas sp. ASW11-130]|uniref:alpha-amylase family glycosyl hydrolase n=1 Tax=Alteromonas sp. ASW11-130 TaxID=3015775 RepID=UPI0022426E40|nr:alpha-amylase family glycosyl hydrolase [Alteromonas sp. ASW11-130]MCW8092905.1 alpha-amylase family glycosyl hydrolase [Alteromonas sp. ASW11-130]